MLHGRSVLPFRAIPLPARVLGRCSTRVPKFHRSASTTSSLGMPERNGSSGAKRKAPSATSQLPPKKQKGGDASTKASLPPVVDRRFYPPEMSIRRCKEYTSDELSRPIEELDAALADTRSARESVHVGEAVVHWFRMDLRVQDNHALHVAAEKAKSKGASLICLYIVSPQDLEAHLVGPAKVDFMHRSLEVVRSDLDALDIPLHVETIEKRKSIPKRILELCSEWKATHLYANAEYEVDELRREARLVKTGIEQGVAVDVLSDTCVIAPGVLQTGQGKQFSVYTPFFRAWVAHVHKTPKLLELFPAPSKNPSKARQVYKKLYDQPIPDAPANKRLTSAEKKRFLSMWPAGEHEARRRLDKFLKDRIGDYDDLRNFPASNSTSVISPHLAAGTISARTVIATARDANSSNKLDAGNTGVKVWVSEVVWRDFYRHVLVHWPFICMNKCFKPEYVEIEWSYDSEKFTAWKEGRTGFPIVDAGMRQLAHTGWMHNRVRMVVASFLAKDLLIDWRLGEQFFMLQLVDGDFASNHGGWGFCSSAGVDPNPYFRIFNPKLQSEKFDAKGDYIRKWVPELGQLSNKDIHAPWEGSGKAAAKKAGYPEPIVDHAKARAKCLEVMKRGLGRDTA